MNNLFVSLIIAVYKDTEALNVILNSLTTQTYENFEVIIAEDGEDANMRNFVKSWQDKANFDIIHTTQEDIGIRKSKSQNNAIRNSNGDYLIFIDGDCVLYSNFIKYHVELAQNGCFIGGRRVNLGPKYSKLLREEKISPLELEKKFLLQYIKIAKDSKESHTEEGFSFSLNSIIYKLFLKNRKKNLKLLGCNFGCFKKNMLKINGFDEELEDAAVAADTDIQWRLEAIGLKMKSCRFIANQFHLYHKRDSSQERALPQKFLENKKNNRYICRVGIEEL